MAVRSATDRSTRLLEFLRTEEASGVFLLAAALVALVWANSGFAEAYHQLWSTIATLGIGSVNISLDLQGWVNEGLMTLFFLVVGLEIKREVTTGELRDPRTLALPIMAAIGGMGSFPRGSSSSSTRGTEQRAGGASLSLRTSPSRSAS
jgi:NhaA family Na+:H+ antiporter